MRLGGVRGVVGEARIWGGGWKDVAGEIVRGVEGRACVFLPTGGRGAEGREGAGSGDERLGMRGECVAGGEVMGRWDFFDVGGKGTRDMY